MLITGQKLNEASKNFGLSIPDYAYQMGGNTFTLKTYGILRTLKEYEKINERLPHEDMRRGNEICLAFKIDFEAGASLSIWAKRVKYLRCVGAKK